MSGAGKMGHLQCKRVELGPYLTLDTKINSKQIKDLNIRPKCKKPPRRKQYKSFWTLVWAMTF